MAWTAPRTWVAGEFVTAAIMNSAVRDNLNILKTSINDDGTLKITAGAAFTQLASANGTAASNALTNMLTAALSGLSSHDTLYGIVVLGCVTQTPHAPILYSVTDSAALTSAFADPGAGNVFIYEMWLKQRQTGTTKVIGVARSSNVSDTNLTTLLATTTTTAFTGAWTAALRIGGGTAGGTADYEASLYKIAG